MDESQIAAQLKQNLPQPYQTDIAPQPEPDTTNGQATVATDYPLDEIVQYKLHDYFGETYKPNDETKRQQLSYIYEEVSGMLEDKEYGFVVARIRELERMIGTANSDNRLYRLYQWLKLNNVRRNIDAQMGALSA